MRLTCPTCGGTGTERGVIHAGAGSARPSDRRNPDGAPPMNDETTSSSYDEKKEKTTR